MRVVLQRVRSASASLWHPAGEASVAVDGAPGQENRERRGRETVRIGQGLLALVGFSAQERPESGSKMAQRIVKLRIFNDERGRLNRSLQDMQGELLLIPQITLTASLAKGTRPSFHTAAAPDAARGLFEAFVGTLQALYPKVTPGTFQAHMVVSLENDGPVTFVLEE